MINTLLETKLQQRKEQKTQRALPSHTGLVDLTSNDYFGFASSGDLIRNAQQTYNRIGATGSRLLTGNDPLYHGLEARIADYHHAESCLIYNTGYLANLGLIAAIGTKEVTFLYDLEIHASMIDGMNLSKARSRPFRHNDLASLEQRLKETLSPVFVLIESLYSMSGNLAPLREIALLCSHYGAGLIVDEAHATGIYGPHGAGLVTEYGLESQVFARVHTFSKVLGVHGACVLGSARLREYLIHFSRPFIYTTALPSPILSMIGASYDKLQKEAAIHQKRLQKLVGYFQKKLGMEGAYSPIQPIAIPDIEQVRSRAKSLQEMGLDVRAILPPTVKRGTECLRVVLHSFNCEEEIDLLAKALE